MGLKARRWQSPWTVRKVKGADPHTRAALNAFFPSNCPVVCYAGDGTNVGRCWHWLGEDGNTCPVHGDVSDKEWNAVELRKKGDHG